MGFVSAVYAWCIIAAPASYLTADTRNPTAQRGVQNDPARPCGKYGRMGRVRCICTFPAVCTGSNCNNGRAVKGQKVSGFLPWLPGSTRNASEACADCSCALPSWKTPHYCSDPTYLAALQALRSKSRKIYVAYLSAPTAASAKKRETIRRRCGCLYEAAGILPRFYVGLPVPWAGDNEKIGYFLGKPQGALATPEAVAASDALVAEAKRTGDVVPMFAWDTYTSIISKVAAIMRDGVASGADFIFKIDDDMCVSPEHLHFALKTFTSSRGPGEELYLGQYLFSGTEYPSMRGYDGRWCSTWWAWWCSTWSVAPYQSGPAYVLSSGLARSIFVTDRLHTTFHYSYGSTSEDATMGKWIRYAEKTRGVVVKTVTIAPNAPTSIAFDPTFRN